MSTKFELFGVTIKNPDTWTAQNMLSGPSKSDLKSLGEFEKYGSDLTEREIQYLLHILEEAANQVEYPGSVNDKVRVLDANPGTELDVIRISEIENYIVSYLNSLRQTLLSVGENLRAGRTDLAALKIKKLFDDMDSSKPWCRRIQLIVLTETFIKAGEKAFEKTANSIPSTENKPEIISWDFILQLRLISQELNEIAGKKPPEGVDWGAISYLLSDFRSNILRSMREEFEIFVKKLIAALTKIEV